MWKYTRNVQLGKHLDAFSNQLHTINKNIRILLVKISFMDDIIYNTLLVHDIKQHYPKAIIYWVVEESFADLAKLNP